MRACRTDWGLYVADVSFVTSFTYVPLHAAIVNRTLDGDGMCLPFFPLAMIGGPFPSTVLESAELTRAERPSMTRRVVLAGMHGGCAGGGGHSIAMK